MMTTKNKNLKISQMYDKCHYDIIAENNSETVGVDQKSQWELKRKRTTKHDDAL